MTTGHVAPVPRVAGDLPDPNVWLALAIAEQPHHQAAQTSWREQTAAHIWFCRVTLRGLTRLPSQPRLLGEAALSLRNAFDVYLHFAAPPEVGFCIEPADCEPLLASLLGPALPARRWTDACLSAFAFACAGGQRLVTFAENFARFGSATWLLLSPRQIHSARRLLPSH